MEVLHCYGNIIVSSSLNLCGSIEELLWLFRTYDKGMKRRGYIKDVGFEYGQRKRKSFSSNNMTLWVGEDAISEWFVNFRMKERNVIWLRLTWGQDTQWRRREVFLSNIYFFNVPMCSCSSERVFTKIKKLWLKCFLKIKLRFLFSYFWYFY